MIVAGIGCRTGVSAEAILTILEEAIRLVPSLVMRGVDPRIDPSRDPDTHVAAPWAGPGEPCAGDDFTGTALALAVPDFRRDEPGVTEAARRLGLAVVWVGRAALKGEQGRCLTRSARAEAEVGLACIAEAAALSVAGAGSRLILPRIAGGGVTCALAEEAAG